MPYIALDPTTAQPAPATTLGAPLTSVGSTLADYRGRLNLQLGARPDLTNGILEAWINDAYIDTCASLEIDELKASLTLTTISGQPLYLLPDVVRAIREAGVIDATTYGPLGGRKLSLSDLPQYRRNATLTDEPREYFREGKMLVLWPTPKTARNISLDIWLRPQPLVNDTDSPFIPQEWHLPILLNARSMAHSDLREYDRAAAAENTYVNTVRRKEDPESLEEADRIVGSSVPRNRHSLFRRPSMRPGRDVW
jgi:hypothetical protein